MTAGLAKDRLTRLDEVMAGHVASGAVPGLSYVVARGDDVHIGAAGSLEPGGSVPVARDTIFRISSMTKPITAVAALILLEECVIRLDDPVDDLLPELADRRVLARPDGPFDETVPANQPITVRDLLTFRLGWGMDFTAPWPQPMLEAMAKLGLGGGPPAPGGTPEPDEWMRRIGTLPLQYQPGERWLYHVGADVLGVLVARAAGRPLETFMRERIFEPLGMKHTSFAVPESAMSRFGACFGADPATGERTVYDPPDGQWSTPPAFQGGGAGLVSTVDDYFAFASMLRGDGTLDGTQILSRPSVEAMTTDHLTDAQRTASGPDPWGALGWGYGVGVQVRRTGPTRSVATYGWDGGLGSQWANDPAEDLVGVLMTNQAWTTPFPPPPAFRDFRTCAYTAFAD